MTYRPVLFALFAVGCTSSDYGPPTDTTTITLDQDGGFAGPGHGRGVHIVGTAVTFTDGSRTGHSTIATSDVASIIHDLENVDFLDLDASYSHCTMEATDSETATIGVVLSAGSQTVSHYLGCGGGVFDDLTKLDQHIYDLSGFTAWSLVP